KLKELETKISEAKAAKKQSKWTLRGLEKEKLNIKQELLDIVIGICQNKIKDLDDLIASNGDPSVISDCILKKKELEDARQRLLDNNGLREYYQDLLNPKIAENQYSNQLGSKQPFLVAFTSQDKEILESQILPTLRDLFAMAEESIKGGKFNQGAFNK